MSVLREAVHLQICSVRRARPPSSCSVARSAGETPSAQEGSLPRSTTVLTNTQPSGIGAVSVVRMTNAALWSKKIGGALLLGYREDEWRKNGAQRTSTSWILAELLAVTLAPSGCEDMRNSHHPLHRLLSVLVPFKPRFPQFYSPLVSLLWSRLKSSRMSY